MMEVLNWAFLGKDHKLVVLNTNQEPRKSKVWAFHVFAKNFPSEINTPELEELYSYTLKLASSPSSSGTVTVASYASDVCRGYEAEHPTKNQKLDIMTIIIDLNDNHKWTREQIADWLDSLPEQPVWRVDETP